MAEEKKKRRHRKDYLNEFKPNVAGEYIYTGKHYRWDSPRADALKRLWIFGAAALAGSFINGCIPGTGMGGAAWTLLPWLISFISAISVVWALCRLTAGGEKVREYVWRASVEQLPMRCMLCAIGAGASLLGEIVSLFILDFAGKIAGAVIFILLQGVVFATSVALRRSVVRLEWTKE